MLVEGNFFFLLAKVSIDRVNHSCKYLNHAGSCGIGMFFGRTKMMLCVYKIQIYLVVLDVI